MNKIYNDNYKKFYEKGYIVLPLEGKIPHINGKDWQVRTYNFEQTVGDNIGLITGKTSNVICIDIDLYEDEYKKEIYSYLPQLVSGKIGNKGKGNNYFFKYNGEANRKIKLGGNTAVELLGTGNQTVLPPSIHPDFGYQYVWIGKPLFETEPDDLPVLPKDFMDKAEKYIRSIELKYPEKYEKKKAAASMVGASIGGRNEQLFKMCCAMVGDGKPFDQMVHDLYRYDSINHNPPWFHDTNEPHGGGGLKAAEHFVKVTTQNLYRKESFEVPKSVFEPVVKKPEIQKTFKKLPKLIGIGQEIFDDLYKNSPVPRTQLCFMNTINLLSILIGNKFYHRGTACNLYQYGVAPSSSGKDFSFKRSKQMLIDSGCSNLLGSTSPTSDSVVLSLLETNREKVMFINEAESLLKRIIDDRKNNGLRECLTDLYDYGGKMHSPKFTMSASKTAKKKTDAIGHVFSPFVNILMTSTDAAFEQYASDNIFNTGFFSRFLFYFEDRYKDEQFIEDYNPPIDNKLLEAIRALGQGESAHSEFLESQQEFELNHAIISDEGNKAYKQVFEEVQKEKKKYSDSKFMGLISRKLYFVNKLTTLHHVMINPNNYTCRAVEPISYLWAKSAVDAIVHNMILNLDESVAATHYGKLVNKFMQYIRSRSVKKQGTSVRQIDSRFRDIKRNERREILCDLELGGRIRLEGCDYYVVE